MTETGHTHVKIWIRTGWDMELDKIFVSFFFLFKILL